MNLRKGFTLAETLVTMGIVAIIAAIAMPAIMHTKPNQEMVMLKKVYYMTGRLVNELINDEDFYPDAETEAESGFSHIHTVPPAVYHGQTMEGDTKFCRLFAARLNTKGGDHCQNASVTAATTFVAHQPPAGEGHFTTTDDVVWVLPISAFANRESITVDVNGERPGNCFVTDANCAKPDRFVIELDKWGKIYVEDALTRKYLSTSNTTKTYDEIRREMALGL